MDMNLPSFNLFPRTDESSRRSSISDQIIATKSLDNEIPFEIIKYYNSSLNITQDFLKLFGVKIYDEYKAFRHSNCHIKSSSCALTILTFHFITRGNLMRDVNACTIVAIFLYAFCLFLSIIMIIKVMMKRKVIQPLTQKLQNKFRLSTTILNVENVIVIFAPMGEGFYLLGRVLNPCPSVDQGFITNYWNTQYCNSYADTHGLNMDNLLLLMTIILIIQVFTNGGYNKWALVIGWILAFTFLNISLILVQSKEIVWINIIFLLGLLLSYEIERIYLCCFIRF